MFKINYLNFQHKKPKEKEYLNLKETKQGAGVQPQWIQGIRSVDGIGVRKTYLLIDIRNIRLD